MWPEISLSWGVIPVSGGLAIHHKHLPLQPARILKTSAAKFTGGAWDPALVERVSKNSQFSMS